MAIIYDSSIRHLNNITWSKVSSLQEIPEILDADKLSGVYIQNEKHRRFKNDAIINLSVRLRDLQADLDRYNPSLIQRIINFFTGKLFNLCRLKNCLSDIVQKVSRIANRILDNQEKEQKRLAEIKAREEAKALAIKIEEEAKALALKKAEEERKQALDDALNKAKKALNFASKTDAQEVFKAFEKLDAPNEKAIENGDEIRVNESNLPISAEDLNYKLTLVGRAKKIVDQYASTFSATNSQTETPDYSLQTVMKAQKYIRMLLIKLAQNKNVPLPRWYHATGKYDYGNRLDTVEKIIRGGFLHQSAAPWGYGAFFSTRDEGEGGYGPHTFVVDEGAFLESGLCPLKGSSGVKFSEVCYFLGSASAIPEKAFIGKRDRYQSLWLRVTTRPSSQTISDPTDCVPVNPNTVAFMATTKPVALRQKLKELKCPISALDREDTNFIRLVFDAAETQKHSNFSKYEKEQDLTELKTQQQSALVKYRDKGKLIAAGGRYIPPSWKACSHGTFGKNYYHLDYINNSKKLEVTRRKISLAEVIESLIET